MGSNCNKSSATHSAWHTAAQTTTQHIQGQWDVICRIAPLDSTQQMVLWCCALHSVTSDPVFLSLTHTRQLAISTQPPILRLTSSYKSVTVKVNITTHYLDTSTQILGWTIWGPFEQIYKPHHYVSITLNTWGNFCPHVSSAILNLLLSVMKGAILASMEVYVTLMMDNSTMKP